MLANIQSPFAGRSAARSTQVEIGNFALTFADSLIRVDNRILDISFILLINVVFYFLYYN